MNKKSIIILIISILIFIGALAIFVYAKSLDTKEDTPKTTTASIENNNNTKNTKEVYFYDIDGKKINFSNFSNKPTVILLWKSDNLNSFDMISLFQQYYNDYKNNINFLAINVNEPDIDLDLINDVKAANFGIPMYFDTDFSICNEFSYEKLPYLVFIEKDGTVGKDFSETVSEDAFSANLDLISENY